MKIKHHLCFQPNAIARQWLTSPNEDSSQDATAGLFARWILSRMSENAFVEIDKVLVDRAVLEAHFACVPERCTSSPHKKPWRCCCVDLAVPLTSTERRRLRSCDQIQAWLLGREKQRISAELFKPRSKSKVKNSRSFFLEDDGITLRHFRGRCIFSTIDSRNRIRCHLHALSRRMGVPLSELQPISCRLFPLVLVDMGQRVMLTVVDRSNYRVWQSLPPWRYPCLSDPSLPRLITSMGPTMDWLLGDGFSKTLKQIPVSPNL